jgi:osmotically-inducible protein OsmY
VESEIITDVEVHAGVLNQLLSSPATRLASINVSVDHGVVNLGGSVGTEQIRLAAEAITSQQPGVLQVRNELTIEADDMAWV